MSPAFGGRSSAAKYPATLSRSFVTETGIADVFNRDAEDAEDPNDCPW